MTFIFKNDVDSYCWSNIAIFDILKQIDRNCLGNSASGIHKQCCYDSPKTSPTSSLEVDIDVGRPNIDVEHCRKNTEKLRNYLEHRNGRPLVLKLETKYEERSQRNKAETKEYGSKQSQSLKSSLSSFSFGGQVTFYRLVIIQANCVSLICLFWKKMKYRLLA